MNPDKEIVRYILWDMDMTRKFCIAKRLAEIEKSQKSMKRNVLTLVLITAFNLGLMRASNQIHSEKIKKLREEIEALKNPKGE